MGLTRWPNFLPNRKVLTPLFLPLPFHIPQDANLRAVGFSFTGVKALGTVYQSMQLHPAFLAWALVGTDDQVGSTGFQVQLWHITPSGQRQFFSTSVMSGLAMGSAYHPHYITEPELFADGDSIRCQVKNLSTTLTDDIWVALWGGDVDISGLQPQQGKNGNATT